MYMKTAARHQPATDSRVFDVINLLRQDRYKVTELRNTLDHQGKDAYDVAKKRLPCLYSLWGLLVSAARTTSSAQWHRPSGHRQIGKWEATRLKVRLTTDPYVLFCFYSPSDHGVKSAFGSIL